MKPTKKTKERKIVGRFSAAGKICYKCKDFKTLSNFILQRNSVNTNVYKYNSYCNECRYNSLAVPYNEYSNIHQWLRRNYGKADKCEIHNCTGISPTYQWGLKKGKKYERNRGNFLKVCRSCHSKMDIPIKTHCVRGHEFTKENIWFNKIRNYRICRLCNKTHARNYYLKTRK